MSGSILLVSDQRDRDWVRGFREAAKPARGLRVVDREHALSFIDDGGFDVMVIDAPSVENVPELVTQIVEARRGSKVVVAAAAPSWYAARAAFEAGAAEYVPKADGPGRMWSTIAQILSWPSSEQTRQAETRR